MDAVTILEKAIRILEKTVQPRHSKLAACHRELGIAHQGLHNTEKARQHFKRAHEIVNSSLGPSHPKTLIYLERLNEALKNPPYSETLDELDETKGEILTKVTSEEGIPKIDQSDTQSRSSKAVSKEETVESNTPKLTAQTLPTPNVGEWSFAEKAGLVALAALVGAGFLWLGWNRGVQPKKPDLD